jgi:hypothetical protein
VIGESYDVEQDDPDGKFDPMKREDVVKNFVPYASIKFGSACYRKPASEQASRSTSRASSCATLQLLALPKQPDILQLRAEDSKNIVLCSLVRAGLFHYSSQRILMTSLRLL